MPRTRRTNPLDLPSRVYFKHGRYWWIAPQTQAWIDLGTDLAAAREEGIRRNGGKGGPAHGSVAYYLQRFLDNCKLRVRAKKLAPRTLADYTEDSKPIKATFGRMHPTAIRPEHIARYLERGELQGHAVRANRQRAMLSACFSWMLRNGECPSLERNPCLREYGVKRNTERPRDRYVTDAEYNAVDARAPQSVRDAMTLEYCTLQRPSDILKLTRFNTTRRADGSLNTLTLTQSKTGRTVQIAIEGKLLEVLDRLVHADDLRTLLHNRRGKPYAETSISSMIRKYCRATGTPSFGLQDIKAKGATDMYLRGVPLEKIQVLCGHKSVTTTEIYVKRHIQLIATPNSISIRA